jgi:hypothetical protein
MNDLLVQAIVLGGSCVVMLLMLTWYFGDPEDR